MKKNIIYTLLCITWTLFLCSHTLADDYKKSWEAKGTYFIGCENVDNDAAKEVVFLLDEITPTYRIVIIDGIKGDREWESDQWAYISAGSNEAGTKSRTYPRLIDVNDDGKYEILFYGSRDGLDKNKWHLLDFK